MESGRLVIRDFAQIREASLQFRDLTVLVGAQGTGKSWSFSGSKLPSMASTSLRRCVMPGKKYPSAP